jgi:hypothetical protein
MWTKRGRLVPHTVEEALEACRLPMVPRLGDSWTIRSAVQLLCLQQALAS